MASDSPYDSSSPLFNYADGKGVLFPFELCMHTADNYIDLDGADTSTILGTFVAPYDCALITAQAYACVDGQGAKAAAASTEPVIGLAYGTNPLATAAAGTSCGVITCDGAGAACKKWAGTTDQTAISEGQEISAYLKTAAASATSGNQDGGAKVKLWIAIRNSPA